MDLIIANGRVLRPDGSLEEASVELADGRIARVADALAANGAQVWDASGALVLPGIVDLHGDALERQLLPRPETPFPADLALLETDRQMAANGITTAYHGITYSWEPGLRGRQRAIELLDAIESLRPRLSCDTRIHLRWEVYNLQAEAEIAGWLAADRIDLLAFNDHMAGIAREIDNPAKRGKYLQRTGLTAEALSALVRDLQARGDEVPGAIGRVASLARKHGVVMASHDDETPEMRRRYNAIGCTLCEFPANIETARTSQELGDPIILGAPNVVRGGSHCDRLHAATAVAERHCDVLTSDYFYPCLLQAVFMLVQQRHADLASAWRLVSATPARAAGLTDRGEVVEGQRGDIVVVDDSDPLLPRAIGTFIAGRPAYLRRA